MDLTLAYLYRLLETFRVLIKFLFSFFYETLCNEIRINVRLKYLYVVWGYFTYFKDFSNCIQLLYLFYILLWLLKNDSVNRFENLFCTAKREESFLLASPGLTILDIFSSSNQMSFKILGIKFCSCSVAKIRLLV